MSRTSIASRAARWSAKHRRIAILGWIAFVVLSVVIGGKVGREIAEEDLGNGESRQGEQILAGTRLSRQRDGAGPRPGTRRPQALTTRPSRPRSPRWLRQLSHVEHVTEIESPLTNSNAGQDSAYRRSAIVTFELRGGDDVVVDRVEARWRQSATCSERIRSIGSRRSATQIDEGVRREPCRGLSARCRCSRCRSPS